MLAHLAAQMSQDFVPVRDSDLEGSVALAFYNGPINWDHVFSWNDDTSLTLIKQAFNRASPPLMVQGVTSEFKPDCDFRFEAARDGKNQKRKTR